VGNVRERFVTAWFWKTRRVWREFPASVRQVFSGRAGMRPRNILTNLAGD
jgi:hypothetical protein